MESSSGTPAGTLLKQRYSVDQRYSVRKGSSRGTPTGPCCNRGTLRNRGTLLEKEAAEVPRRDPAATEVLCRPEVLCWKRKQQRYPNGTLLQQRHSADQRYSVGKGSGRGTPTGTLFLISHYIFYPSSLLFLPLDVLALTPPSPNTYGGRDNGPPRRLEFG